MDNIDGQVGETQESTFEETSNDTVPVIDATDEDIESYLSQSEEEENDGVETDEDVEEGEPEPLAEKEETAEEIQADSAKKIEPGVLELQAQNEKLSRQLEATELFVQRRNNEIGELRKKLSDHKEFLEANLETKTYEDPKGAMKDTLKLEKVEAELENLDNEEQNNHSFISAQKFIASNLKQDEMDVDAMCAVLEADGANPAYIQAFRSNPIQNARPTEIVQLGKRASERMRLGKAVGFVKSLYEENQALKAQLKQGPKTMLNRIQKNLSASPGLSGAKATRSSKPSMSSADISDLSESELDEMLLRN